MRAPLALAAILWSCGGAPGRDTAPTAPPSSSTDPTPDPSDCSQLSPAERDYPADWEGVQSWLQDWCRTCHIPQGVAGWDIVAAVREQAAGQTSPAPIPAILVPGDPAASTLWTVTYGQPQPMPQGAPEGQPCAVRAHVQAWILDGAPL